MDYHIRKPFREDELFSVIKAALGLEYVYDEDEISTEVAVEKFNFTPGLLTDVPKAFIKDMNTAVLNGDIERLNHLIEEVKESNLPSAQGLSELAKQYDYDRLIELFTAALDH